MTQSSLGDVEIDLDALMKKYAEERAKRLRPDAVHQFQELKGKFKHFAEDPWSEPTSRSPIVEEVDVLIIGAGLGGLLAASHLCKRGIKNIRIIDKAGDFGGTWYWNRYPGCACDVDSYVYLPLLEDTGYIPSEKYAKAGEIYAHCRRIAEHFGLYPAAMFHTGVNALRWDERSNRWRVSTDRNDRITARFVISCTGLLSKPKLPGIAGVETFEGHCFHTSRWDYGYTGGDARGSMAGLKDKVVGVIGTGATGIQAVPKLAESAKHLYVFQRTPSSVDYRGNRPTDAAWAKALHPGWHQERTLNFTLVTSGYARVEDLVDDAWTEIMKIIAPPNDGPKPLDLQELFVAEMKKMELTRRRVAEIIHDPATAETLKPYYHYFCKRPAFSDEYLQAFNRPNVTLVDTAGLGVERITPTGVIVAGKAYGIDCLVYATGFDFLTDYAREAGIDVYGRGGRSLSESWAEGTRTLFGMQSHGFPNFLLLGVIQAGVSHNYTHVADEQANHISYIIAECIKRGTETVDVTKEAEDAWVAEIVSYLGPRRAFAEACTPGYYNHEGKRDRAYALNEPYMAGPMPYIEKLREWREAGTMPGLIAVTPHQ